MRGALPSLAALAPLAACSFQHGAAPDQPSDAPTSDTRGADKPRCDPATCKAASGKCTHDVCVIDATDGEPVACPSDCTVNCAENNESCRTGLSCPEATSCAFRCTGDHVCDNSSTLECAPGSDCEVFCKGGHACVGLTINCAAGATCTYHCCSGMSCTGGFACIGAGCVEGAPSCP